MISIKEIEEQENSNPIKLDVFSCKINDDALYNIMDGVDFQIDIHGIFDKIMDEEDKVKFNEHMFSACKIIMNSITNRLTKGLDL